MMTDAPDATNQDNNPIDMIIDLAEAKDYSYIKQDEDNLHIKIIIKGTEIAINLTWQEEFAALLVSCFVPVEIDDNIYEATIKILETINKNVWLGHFDLSGHEDIVCPTFRHTLLLSMMPAIISINIISDVIDIAISECERFFDTFQQAKEGDTRLQDGLDAIIFETVGEA